MPGANRIFQSPLNPPTNAYPPHNGRRGGGGRRQPSRLPTSQTRAMYRQSRSLCSTPSCTRNGINESHQPPRARHGARSSHCTSALDTSRERSEVNTWTDTGVIADHEEIAHDDAAGPVISRLHWCAYLPPEHPCAGCNRRNGPPKRYASPSPNASNERHVDVAVAHRERAQGLTL